MKIKKTTHLTTRTLFLAITLLLTSSLNSMAQEPCTNPLAPVISGDLSICQGNDAVLSAAAEADEVRWFSAESQGTLLHTGNELVLENLVQNTSVWAESVNFDTGGQNYTGGARVAPGTNISGSAVSPASKPWGLRFTITEDIVLNSVDVYIIDNAPGTFVIQLQDVDYNILEEKTVELPAGSATEPLKYTIDLDFSVPAGSNYSLVSPISPKLIRETKNYHTGYPYALGDIGVITQGMIQNIPTASNSTTYYFFYNWDFSVFENCLSARVKADITVNEIPAMPIGEVEQTFLQGETLNDLDVTGTNLTWYADSNGDQVLEGTTTLIDGSTYYVSQTITDCESDLLAITVQMGNTPEPCTNPLVPVITGDLSICKGDVAVLTATVEADDVRWYSAPAQGTVLYTGFEMILENLTKNTSLWAESVNYDSVGQNYTGGARVDPGTYTGGSAVSPPSSPWGLRFTLLKDIVLNSVDVFILSETPGLMIVNLQDANYNILETKIVNLPAGSATEPLKYTIDLGFSIPAGAHYSLVAPSSPKLIREGAAYHPGFPYALGDVGYISQGMLQNIPEAANSATYYFFYNWAFSAFDDCTSDKVRVDITVNNIPGKPTGAAVQIFSQGETLNDLNVTGTNLTWYADSNGDQVLEGTTALIDETTYYVSQTVNNCESGLLAITAKLGTGVNELSADRIKIYPVPASDILHISSNVIVNSVEIFNTMGQSVKRINANDINGSIFIGDLVEGMYIIQLRTPSNVITKRIIKE